MHIHNDPGQNAITGTKRDSSQLARESSVSPTLTKVRIVEKDIANKPEVDQEKSIDVELEQVTNTSLETEPKLNPNMQENTLNKEPEKYIETKDPNVKTLPKEVQVLVSEGSKEAIAPGNGTCPIGTTALHIAGDTIQISKDLNTHIASNRDWYLPKIEGNFSSHSHYWN